jgi:aldehyde:ferredoxin oxidoreductase
MGGYMGRILFIDLSRQEFWTQETQEEMKKMYIGGKGFGIKLLYDLTPPGIEPFDERMPIIFVSGPLTGTFAPSMRGCVVSKSPLNNMFDDSYFGGHFIQEIKYAGFDAIVLTGKSAEPVYLIIKEGTVEFNDAKHVWGLDTYATYEKLKKGDLKQAKICCIGPAGENLVKYALIDCDFHRQAGRGGLGAVMGAKRLKAILVLGSEGVTIHDKANFIREAISAYDCLKENTKELAEYSTLGSIGFANEFGYFPIENYEYGSSEKVKGIDYPEHQKNNWLRHNACAACPIHCGKIGKIRTGRYKGTLVDNVEYETAGLMGGNLGVFNVNDLVYLNYLCDRLGLDTISTGGVLGFLVDAYKHNKISSKHLNGIKPEFGDLPSFEKLICDIAYRRSIGDILAEGVAEASKVLGEECYTYAVHIQGYETPAWGPRGSEGMAIAFLTGDRGGCHQRAFPVIYEATGNYKDRRIEDGRSQKDKHIIVIEEQNLLAALYSLTICDFARSGIDTEKYLRLLDYCTGIQLTKQDFLKTGERIWNLIRMYNIREGWVQELSYLPVKFRKPLPNGLMAGHCFSEYHEQQLLKLYNEARGWDEKGVPSEQKLEELGLLS